MFCDAFLGQKSVVILVQKQDAFDLGHGLGHNKYWSKIRHFLDSGPGPLDQIRVRILVDFGPKPGRLIKIPGAKVRISITEVWDLKSSGIDPPSRYSHQVTWITC